MTYDAGTAIAISKPHCMKMAAAAATLGWSAMTTAVRIKRAMMSAIKAPTPVAAGATASALNRKGVRQLKA